jgi:hypothetical protein
MAKIDRPLSRDQAILGKWIALNPHMLFLANSQNVLVAHNKPPKLELQDL